MTCAAVPADDVCPCGAPHFPVTVCNAPDLPAIEYRVGAYLEFRGALLQSLVGEQALTAWRPGGEGDLAVQMIEWWAYLADILTFYNERIANENYLGTATLPESVNHLVQLLGYRPRPALGASGMLAALLTPGARTPLVLPQGLQVQSKPGPGQPPQIFELESPASLQSPDVVTADVVPSSAPLLGTNSDGSSYVWLAGQVKGVKPGDRLLLINQMALTSQTAADHAWIAVTGTTPQTDPLGNAVTQLNFSSIVNTLAFGAQAAQYVLLKAGQSSPLWNYPTQSGVTVVTQVDGTTTRIELAGIARALTPGSLLLLDVSSAASSAAAQSATTVAAQSAAALLAADAALSAAQAALAAATGKEIPAAEVLLALERQQSAAAALATSQAAASAGASFVATPCIVKTNSETVWYANGNGPNPPATSSPPGEVPAISMPHSGISFASVDSTGDWAALWNANAASVTVRWGWAPSATLAPVLTTGDVTYRGGSMQLIPAAGQPAFSPTPVSVMLEDQNGNAGSGITGQAPAPGAIDLNISAVLSPSGLVSPIDVLFNLLPFSRGKSVLGEVLGSGNPSVAGQDFTLKNAPITYFADTASISGNGFSSTVKVSVNGVRWREVQSFYRQPRNAQVFVLREDDTQQTHVMFGDGVNGALLPTGTNNVTADYRYGAGAVVPAPETLTVIQTPQPGLKGVRNPLAPVGGSDADSPARLSTLAPRSVLAFERAVSLDDYVAIALAASTGVTGATAAFSFDATSQRPVVTLWVAGDAGATAAVTAALAGITVPGQGLTINTATGLPMQLSLTYVRDPRYDDAVVRAGLSSALIDPNTGLFGACVIGIGQSIYASQIEAACLAVSGVLAVHQVQLKGVSAAYRAPSWIVSRFPFRGAAPLPRNCAGNRHDPGVGSYYVLTSANLTLNPAAP